MDPTIATQSYPIIATQSTPVPSPRKNGFSYQLELIIVTNIILNFVVSDTMQSPQHRTPTHLAPKPLCITNVILISDLEDVGPLISVLADILLIFSKYF